MKSQLEVLRRNARYRAWRTYGLPLDGTRWEKRAPGYGWFFFVECSLCDAGLRLHNPEGAHWDGERCGEGIFSFEELEREALEDMTRDYQCRHLVALLGEDPPEVAALAALELMAC